jgi:ribonuclease-3
MEDFNTQNKQRALRPLETPADLIKGADEIEQKLGYRFKNRAHLLLAFVHRSYVNEHPQIKENNERLEFLGDSVLGMVIAEYLYDTLPNTPEGELSFLRSRLVEASSCLKFLDKLDLDRFILLSKGEMRNVGRGRDSIRADLFEAIVGAIYLDGGLKGAKDFIFLNFSKEIQEIIQTPVRNWKALLQDFCQRSYQNTPIYEVVAQEGPDHNKHFTISVIVNNKQVGKGCGRSKKEAEQEAAKDALSKIPGIA